MIPIPLSMPPPIQDAPAEAAQDAGAADLETIEMRVLSIEGNRARVDRGTLDGLAVHDRVVFRPLDGRHLEGSVVHVGERDALIDLDDPSAPPAAGTRAEARIPRSRRGLPPAPAEFIGPLPDPPEREHPPWQRPDDEWTQGEPLLAHVRPLRPSERDPRLTGRAYSIFDYSHSTEGSRSDMFARAGTSLLFENFMGKGGDLHFDAEANYRNTVVPDDDDEEDTRLRLDRLSYAWGGNRFAPDRYEVGRFLQHVMPEFGVLDGGQWMRRAARGDIFGGSVGFIPQIDDLEETGDDIQVAAFYRWVADESEQLSLAAGYQKTFHDLNADRDLFIGKLYFAPIGGWNVAGTAWVDLYTDGDDAKGPGLGLTQAYVSAGKAWKNGGSFRATYTHREFPENDLDAFLPVTANQLADDHYERVSASVRQTLGRRAGMFGSAGAWVDEDDDGYDAEGGVEFLDVLFDAVFIEAAAFTTQGQFSNTLGYRAAIGSTESWANWRLGYDFTHDDIDGFAADNDEIPQHRVRASVNVNTETRWNFSLYAEVLLFDDEESVLAGLFLQRSF